MSRSNSLRAYKHDSHSKHSESSCSDSCDCHIKFQQQKCKLDRDCALKVAAKASLSSIGCVKVYMIEIVLKNCTKEILQFVTANLELDASSFLITSDCNSPPSDCVQVIGLDHLDPDCRASSITTDIDAGGLAVNQFWTGASGNSSLFVGSGCGAGSTSIQLPPGETRIKIRIIANVGDLYIVSPLLTTNAVLKCCGPIRIATTIDTSDCLPSMLSLETCPVVPCCPVVPQ